MNKRIAKKIVKAVSQGDRRYHPHQVAKAGTIMGRVERRP